MRYLRLNPSIHGYCDYKLIYEGKYRENGKNHNQIFKATRQFRRFIASLLPLDIFTTES